MNLDELLNMPMKNESFCSYFGFSCTSHDDLLAKVMNDTDNVSADLAHLSSSNLFMLQPFAGGDELNTVMPTTLC